MVGVGSCRCLRRAEARATAAAISADGLNDLRGERLRAGAEDGTDGTVSSGGRVRVCVATGVDGLFEATATAVAVAVAVAAGGGLDFGVAFGCGLDFDFDLCCEE